MAGVSDLGSTWTTTAGNKTVTATPSLGDLIIIVAPATGVATSAVTDNNADGGGTYTKIGSSFTGWSTAGDLSMWVRNARIGSATSTIFTVTQTSSTGGGMEVLAIFGMKRAGLSAIKQSAGQSTGTAGTTPAPTFGAAPDTNNAIIGAVCNAATVAGSVVISPIGWTETVDLVYATPAAGFEVIDQISGVTTATITWGGISGTAFGSMVIELDASAPTAINVAGISGMTTGTSPKLMPVSYGAGDLVLVLAMAATNTTSQNFGTPTWADSTGFTAIDNDTTTTSTNCRGSSFKAVATASGTGNISVTEGGATVQWGFMVVVVPAGQHNNVGVHGNPNSSNVYVQSLTVAALSAVVELMGDWSAAAVTPRTWTPTGQTEIAAGVSAGQYSWFAALWPAQSAGTRNYGITGLTATGPVTRVYVEVLAAAGGPAPSRPRAARRRISRSKQPARANYAA